MRIEHSEVVVTGAAGGLGGAIARALCARGARLILTDRREARLNTLAGQLNAEAVVCDLADAREVTELVARLNTVDIVVANAALPATGKLNDFSPEQLDRAVEVNLRVPMSMTHRLLPGMLDRGRGHFVYISSIAGKLPSARVPVYSATKAGLRGFCGSLRQDLHGTGVGASVVFPGTMTDGGMLADAHLPSTPGTKGTSCDFVARRVVAAIERNLGEVDAAEFPVRAMARFGGVAPELAARIARRKDSVAWGDRVAQGLRHLR